VTPQVLEAVLADRFAALPAQSVLEHARRLLEAPSPNPGDTLPSRPPLSYWQGLFSAVVRHPYGYELTHALRELLGTHRLAVNVDELIDAQVRLQFEATGVVDELTSRVFSTACSVEDLKRWGPAFGRLLKSGPSERTASILDALLLHLKRDDRDARRKSHYLIGSALAAATATGETSVVRWLAERIVSDMVAGEETYEFSDLLAGAGEMLMSAGAWDALAPLSAQLRSLEEQTQNPVRRRVSAAVLERWRQPQWTHLLFRVAEEDETSCGDAAAILAAVGGKEVACRAAALITHSQRRVRLTMLDLLTGLGPLAVSVCAELIAPPELWQKRGAQGSLDDTSWYTIRNAFHILGRIGQEGTLELLKPHLSDPDRRVRLEIIRALERMGSAEARALLVPLAEDSVLEVRRAALSAMGSVGAEHEVFILQELFRSDPESAETALYAIGHIGGREAKDFLFGLLEQDAPLAGAGYLARAEALREAALKALVQNPDAEIVQRIEQYCRRTQRTFRIPLVTDTLSDTGRIKLDRSRSQNKRA
jgi:HEAT repeat protein